jgi:hypothetical protein
MSAAMHCNRDYEGEIKEKGDRVKILTVGDVASYDYARNKDLKEPDELTDEAQWLDIDMAKYCHVAIDDIDKAQANQKLMAEAQRKLGLKMADDIDSDIFGLYSKISRRNGRAHTADRHLEERLQLPRDIGRNSRGHCRSPRDLSRVAPAFTRSSCSRGSRRHGQLEGDRQRRGGETALRHRGFRIEHVVYSARGTMPRADEGGHFLAVQLTETSGYRPERRFGDAV